MAAVLTLPPRIAWTLAVVAALAAGGAVAAGVAPIEPGLGTALTTLAVTETSHIFELRAWPTGGEDLTQLRIERDARIVTVIGRDSYPGLRTDNAARFQIQVLRETPEDPVVRLVGEGRMQIVREVRLPVDRPGAKR